MEIPLAVALGLVVVLLLGALAGAAALFIKSRSTREQLRQASADSAARAQQVAALQTENARLNSVASALQAQTVQLQTLATQLQGQVARYAAITDAEAWAAQLRAHAEQVAAMLNVQARQTADRLVAEAEAKNAAAQRMASQASNDSARVVGVATQQAAQIRAQADQSANAVLAEARRTADKLAADAQAAMVAAQSSVRATLAQASNEGTRIVDSAKRRAQEIAGEALTAVEEAKRLEKTAEAMRNIIDGYGDRYVVPAAGLLDELAEEFGFAEAGQQLKSARAQVRAMISQGTAATCDYVEANRRTTAIAFVLDAFNGKVDTILADVKHDNCGTLRQKIVDAFALVNENGAAFRNARISAEYRDARLQELRWAVVAQELRLKEREEQRLIKERIREEERAQREYDKAMKEAQKEEDVLRKAMEKAQREIDRATSDQRAQFEAQLQELSEKLRQAEEKNQRALSMAQQTKTGHVYVISNVGSFGDDVFKIGLTRRLEPFDRVRELGDASVPFEFDVHAMIPSQDAPALEFALHKQFLGKQVNKVNPRKEFFRVGLREIKQAVDQLGIQATWTIAAEAKDYRETQAIERSIANKTFDERTWREQQLREQQHETLMPEMGAANAVS